MWRGSVTGGTNGVGLTWKGTSNQGRADMGGDQKSEGPMEWG